MAGLLASFWPQVRVGAPSDVSEPWPFPGRFWYAFRLEAASGVVKTGDIA